MARKSCTIVSLLLALTLIVPASFAGDAKSAAQLPPPLPLGCWSFNGNGSLGMLCIPSLQSDNSFVGQLVFEGYTNIVTGLWSSGPQQISFLRLGIPNNPLSYQAYTGFLFPANATDPTGPQVLAGSFSVYGPLGGSSQTANMFGWTATHQ